MSAAQPQHDKGGPLGLNRRIRRDLDQHLAEIVAPEHFGKGGGDGLEALADIFIMPPDLEELRRRLEGRGTENAQQIAKRIQAADAEMADWKSYRYTILSSSMEEDLIKFRAIIRAERYLSRRLNLQHG